MAYLHRHGSSGSSSTATRNSSDHDLDLDLDLRRPFGHIEGLERDDIRETAYEIFFTACRASPGFGGRNALTYYSSITQDSSGIGGGGGGGVDFGGPAVKAVGVGMASVSRVKRALGLKMVRRTSSRRTIGNRPGSPGGGSQSPGRAFGPPPSARPKRPLTSAEIMRQQMGVSEQGDNRLRKTLMRTLVGQMGRRAETIILPLELLRHLKPSEFNDLKEYHSWQRRHLKIIEAGLLRHPFVPLDAGNPFAARLREIMFTCETRPVDAGKNSETMRSLCNSVVSLSWRSPSGGAPPESCHWADGYPFNLHLYLALLRSIFDLRDETLVLDEVDELLELMKKTWSTLGLNRAMHHVCLMWVLFHQYIITGQSEPDLLCASHAMMAEVANDARKGDREAAFVKVVSPVLLSIRCWAEKRLLDYHLAFQKGALMETLLPLALSAAKILDEDLAGGGDGRSGAAVMASSGNHVDYYIRSSIKNAFARMLEVGNALDMRVKMEAGVSDRLLQLAKEIEETAAKEKECFSPALKKWHPIAGGVGAVTLHNCYGTLLRQYLAGVSTLTGDVIAVLQRAGELEQHLVQMVAEDSVDCEDGGKTIVREMAPYEVDSIVLDLLKAWMEERVKKGKDCVRRAKESETWNPMSKTEPYAQSAMELVKLAKQTVEDFFEIPVGISEYVVQNLANGLEVLFQEYATFVASCGSKQNYIPSLPPLTRCNMDSKLMKLWKKAAPCSFSGTEDRRRRGTEDGLHPRPSTSRGTQRLYIRLNTLHFLLSHLHSIDKALSLSIHVVPDCFTGLRRRRLGDFSSSYCELARSSIQVACQHVAEVAAYRLLFLDSHPVFYGGLYAGDVANANVRPAVRILKQNLTLLCAILTDRAQAPAVKAVMRAAFESYLMVLLAGGGSRAFRGSDHMVIEEDFESLKRVFCSCGEGMMAEEGVEREAETAEGVVALMGETTEQLVEDFSIVACEASGMGVVGGGGGVGQKLPMPPTTGRWNRSDPNTILRVLCHRNDRTANEFLKRAFQLPKRR